MPEFIDYSPDNTRFELALLVAAELPERLILSEAERRGGELRRALEAEAFRSELARLVERHLGLAAGAADSLKAMARVAEDSKKRMANDRLAETRAVRPFGGPRSQYREYRYTPSMRRLVVVWRRSGNERALIGPSEEEFHNLWSIESPQGQIEYVGFLFHKYQETCEEAVNGQCGDGLRAGGPDADPAGLAAGGHGAGDGGAL